MIQRAEKPPNPSSFRPPLKAYWWVFIARMTSRVGPGDRPRGQVGQDPHGVRVYGQVTENRTNLPKKGQGREIPPHEVVSPDTNEQKVGQ